MKLFETIAKALVYVGIIILVCASFFFIRDYIKKIESYNEYKAKVEKTLSDNKILVTQITELQAKQSVYDKERNDFIIQIANKNKIISEKEKQIIENNTLIIPSDYNSIKSNYLTLFSLYSDLKAISVEQTKQIEKDTQQIFDLSTKLEEAKNNIITNTVVIETQVLKPVPFYKSSILVGGGVDTDNTKSISVAYQGTIRDKFIIQCQATYPPRLTALIGFKL